MNDVNYSRKQLDKDRESRCHMRDELLLLRKQYSMEGLNILELGSGMGDNLALFSDGNAVSGVDGVEEAVLYSCSIGIPAVVMDLDSSVNILSDSYDCILCLDVLEHLLHPDKLMQEMNRILKTNGIAILNVPNHLTLSGRIRILLGSSLDVSNYFPDKNDWDNPHIRFFRHSSFLEMIAVADFQLLEDRSYRFHAVPGLSSRERLSFLSGLLQAAARFNPALFAGGFFVVVQKKRRDSTKDIA